MRWSVLRRPPMPFPAATTNGGTAAMHAHHGDRSASPASAAPAAVRASSSLPPRVKGPPRGILTLSIDGVCYYANSREVALPHQRRSGGGGLEGGSTLLRLAWWGEQGAGSTWRPEVRALDSEGVPLPPARKATTAKPSSSQQQYGVRETEHLAAPPASPAVQYPIVVSAASFTNYLHDAQWLVFELHHFLEPDSAALHRDFLKSLSRAAHANRSFPAHASTHSSVGTGGLKPPLAHVMFDLAPLAEALQGGAGRWASAKSLPILLSGVAVGHVEVRMEVRMEGDARVVPALPVEEGEEQEEEQENDAEHERARQRQHEAQNPQQSLQQSDSSSRHVAFAPTSSSPSDAAFDFSSSSSRSGRPTRSPHDLLATDRFDMNMGMSTALNRMVAQAEEATRALETEAGMRRPVQTSRGEVGTERSGRDEQWKQQQPASSHAWTERDRENLARSKGSHSMEVPTVSPEWPADEEEELWRQRQRQQRERQHHSSSNPSNSRAPDAASASTASREYLTNYSVVPPAFFGVLPPMPPAPVGDLPPPFPRVATAAETATASGGEVYGGGPSHGLLQPQRPSGPPGPSKLLTLWVRFSSLRLEQMDAAAAVASVKKGGGYIVLHYQLFPDVPMERSPAVPLPQQLHPSSSEPHAVHVPLRHTDSVPRVASDSFIRATLPRSGIPVEVYAYSSRPSWRDRRDESGRLVPQPPGQILLGRTQVPWDSLARLPLGTALYSSHGGGGGGGGDLASFLASHIGFQGSLPLLDPLTPPQAGVDVARTVGALEVQVGWGSPDDLARVERMERGAVKIQARTRGFLARKQGRRHGMERRRREQGQLPQQQQQQLQQQQQQQQQSQPQPQRYSPPRSSLSPSTHTPPRPSSSSFDPRTTTSPPTLSHSHPAPVAEFGASMRSAHGLQQQQQQQQEQQRLFRDASPSPLHPSSSSHPMSESDRLARALGLTPETARQRSSHSVERREAATSPSLATSAAAAAAAAARTAAPTAAAATTASSVPSFASSMGSGSGGLLSATGAASPSSAPAAADRHRDFLSFSYAAPSASGPARAPPTTLQLIQQTREALAAASASAMARSFSERASASASASASSSSSGGSMASSRSSASPGASLRSKFAELRPNAASLASPPMPTRPPRSVSQRDGDVEDEAEEDRLTSSGSSSGASTPRFDRSPARERRTAPPPTTTRGQARGVDGAPREETDFLRQFDEQLQRRQREHQQWAAAATRAAPSPQQQRHESHRSPLSTPARATTGGATPSRPRAQPHSESHLPSQRSKPSPSAAAATTAAAQDDAYLSEQLSDVDVDEYEDEFGSGAVEAPHVPVPSSPRAPAPSHASSSIPSSLPLRPFSADPPSAEEVRQRLRRQLSELDQLQRRMEWRLQGGGREQGARGDGRGEERKEEEQKQQQPQQPQYHYEPQRTPSTAHSFLSTPLSSPPSIAGAAAPPAFPPASGLAPPSSPFRSSMPMTPTTPASFLGDLTPSPAALAAPKGPHVSSMPSIPSALSAERPVSGAAVRLAPLSPLEPMRRSPFPATDAARAEPMRYSPAAASAGLPRGHGRSGSDTGSDSSSSIPEVLSVQPPPASASDEPMVSPPTLVSQHSLPPATASPQPTRPSTSTSASAVVPIPAPVSRWASREQVYAPGFSDQQQQQQQQQHDEDGGEDRSSRRHPRHHGGGERARSGSEDGYSSCSSCSSSSSSSSSSSHSGPSAPRRPGVHSHSLGDDEYDDDLHDEEEDRPYRSATDRRAAAAAIARDGERERMERQREAARAGAGGAGAWALRVTGGQHVRVKVEYDAAATAAGAGATAADPGAAPSATAAAADREQARSERTRLFPQAQAALRSDPSEPGAGGGGSDSARSHTSSWRDSATTGGGAAGASHPTYGSSAGAARWDGNFQPSEEDARRMERIAKIMAEDP